GNFTSYKEQTQSFVARVSPDGTLDLACDPGSGPDNSVSSFAIQNDGRILVAGKFTTFNGEQRNGLVRLKGDSPFWLGSPNLLGNGQCELPFFFDIQLI